MTYNFYEKLQSALREEDVEGLIKLGAPEDEYDTEAQFLASYLATLGKNDLTIDNITHVVAATWAKSFNRDDAELELRMPAFRNIAQKILTQ